MMRSPLRPRSSTRGGFTLLELIVAVTILASFLLPVLQILTESRIRAIRTTQLRQIRDLAQQKLHDRIHYAVYADGTICDQDEGDFEREGHSNWYWRVDPPELRSQGEQILLEYTITVDVPFKLGGAETSSSGASGTAAREAPTAGGAPTSGGTGKGQIVANEFGEGSSFSYTAWTFPSESWYEEQDLLFERGLPSLLHGDPSLGGVGGLGTGGF